MILEFTSINLGNILPYDNGSTTICAMLVDEIINTSSNATFILYPYRDCRYVDHYQTSVGAIIVRHMKPYIFRQGPFIKGQSS